MDHPLTSSVAKEPPDLQRHLFYETSHSPSLVDLVGFDRAKDIIDFCFIANPYYPTQSMMAELQSQLPNLIKSYPSSNPALSQAHLGKVLDVDPEHLLIGNGATELITMINEAMIRHIAVPIPTFGEYIEKLHDQRDAELFALDSKTGYQLDLEIYLQWIHHRGIQSALVINPGNPTGQLLSLEQMEHFLNKAKDMELVIVDESFIDFAGETIPSLLPLTDRYSNLLIVRSMSKHCGVPGLRLGYCYTKNLYILNRLRRLTPTWNVNTVAEYFLSLLPSTNTEYHAARLRLIGDIRALYNGLLKIRGVHVYPTGANFVLIKMTNGMTATEAQERLLKDYGMYVRDCSNKVGMDRFHLRIASQGQEKDARLLKALHALLDFTA